MYIDMIHWSIMTWPSNKRLTLVSIETVSRAINSTLAKKDFVNVSSSMVGGPWSNLSILCNTLL